MPAPLALAQESDRFFDAGMFSAMGPPPSTLPKATEGAAAKRHRLLLDLPSLAPADAQGEPGELVPAYAEPDDVAAAPAPLPAADAEPICQPTQVQQRAPVVA